MKRWPVHPAAAALFIFGMGVLALGIVVSRLGGGGLIGLLAREAAPREPGPLRIVATVPPLAWAARQVAPPGAELLVLAPAGAGCEGIELTPTQVAAIHRADVVVRVGLGLDRAAEGVILSTPRAVREQVVFAGVIGAADGHGHSHHHHAGHDCALHGDAPDPHLWLDPSAMERLVAALEGPVRRAMERAGASREEIAELPGRVRRASAVCREIDEEYRRVLAGLPARAIVTHHNAYAHLAARYGLEVAAVLQRDHHAEPTAADVAEAARAVNGRGIRAVFVEPQLSGDAPARLAALTGARLLPLDPLGDGDWPGMMRRNLASLSEGLRAGAE